jgi:hypothetical protein
MPSAAEIAVTLYLYGAEAGMTAVASRPSRARVLLAPRAGSLGGSTLAPPPWHTDRASTVQETALNAASPLTQADLLVGQLLRMEKFDVDWDGSDAAKPLASSLADAREFIRLLAPESIMPRPALHADGHAVLLLNTPDTYAELEFLGDKKIGFYARRGGQEWGEDFFFDGGVLPDGLAQIGFAIDRSLGAAVA